MTPFEIHFTTVKRFVSMETADAAAMLDPGSGGIGSRALQGFLRVSGGRLRVVFLFTLAVTQLWRRVKA